MKLFIVFVSLAILHSCVAIEDEPITETIEERMEEAIDELPNLTEEEKEEELGFFESMWKFWEDNLQHDVEALVDQVGDLLDSIGDAIFGSDEDEDKLDNYIEDEAKKDEDNDVQGDEAQEEDADEGEDYQGDEVQEEGEDQDEGENNVQADEAQEENKEENDIVE